MKKIEFGARYKVTIQNCTDIVVPIKRKNNMVYFYHINGVNPNKLQDTFISTWDTYTELMDIKVAKTRLAYKIYKNKIIKEEGNFYIVRL